MTVLPIDSPNVARRPRRRRPGQPEARLNVTFASLGVPARIAAALAEADITVPYPIQTATLPDALAGLDILGRAQTGSGKTLAFSIPLVAGLAGGHTSAGGHGAWCWYPPVSWPARSMPSSGRSPGPLA